MDLPTLLAQVEEAIARVLLGKTVRLGDREVTYADLDDLRRLREELRRELANSSNAGALMPAVARWSAE